MPDPASARRARARLGLLVPFTNSNLEPDFALMAPGDLSLHVARMGGYDEDKIPDETQMQALGSSDLDGPLSLLMGVKPDIVIYGCTSATLTHGPAFDQALASRIEADHGVPTVTAAGALVHALQRLGVSTIAFASPYVPMINDLAIQFLRDRGMTITSRADVETTLSNEGQGAMTPQDVYDLACRADTDTAEALVLSCTDMRSAETLAKLERDLGKPVICSNQAMLAQVLDRLNLPDQIAGFGTLLERRLL